MKNKSDKNNDSRSKWKDLFTFEWTKNFSGSNYLTFWGAPLFYSHTKKINVYPYCDQWELQYLSKITGFMIIWELKSDQD